MLTMQNVGLNYLQSHAGWAVGSSSAFDPSRARSFLPLRMFRLCNPLPDLFWVTYGHKALTIWRFRGQLIQHNTMQFRRFQLLPIKGNAKKIYIRM